MSFRIEMSERRIQYEPALAAWSRGVAATARRIATRARCAEVWRIARRSDLRGRGLRCTDHGVHDRLRESVA